MTEIGVGRYGDMLRRLLGMRGTSLTPGRDLLPDLNAAFVLENDRPEWAFLKGERRYIGGTGIFAAALEFAEFIVINPIDSGVISVVTELLVVNRSSAARVEIRVEGLARFTTVGNVRPTDQRFEGGIATLLNGISVVALDGVAVGFSRGPIDTTVTFPGLIMILPPGTAFKVVDITANADVSITMLGYERAFESYER